ncbi:MAG: aspartate carbamoyltransferase regulatory subunit [Thermoplasmata archaeon HGW-Thermoplasmata-1]|nr:MAG: aspartate carbamoyltransferase regulatory subunit [Thermoplasmata archaeon HGW-Thermoplasmata-1]
MKELRVQPIMNGTVIDHITPGKALKVLHILGLPKPESTSTISVAINVPGKTCKKDIVKIEDRELESSEVDRIALIAPNATINIIRNYDVVEKHRVNIPEELIGIVRCSNPTCVTNSTEPVQHRFTVVSKNPLRVKCQYCLREPADIENHIL